MRPITIVLSANLSVERLWHKTVFFLFYVMRSEVLRHGLNKSNNKWYRDDARWMTFKIPVFTAGLGLSHVETLSRPEREESIITLASHTGCHPASPQHLLWVTMAHSEFHSLSLADSSYLLLFGNEARSFFISALFNKEVCLSAVQCRPGQRLETIEVREWVSGWRFQWNSTHIHEKASTITTPLSMICL